MHLEIQTIRSQDRILGRLELFADLLERFDALRGGDELGCLEDFAFRLDTLVDILDLLVQLVRLCRYISDALADVGGMHTMGT